MWCPRLYALRMQITKPTQRGARLDNAQKREPMNNNERLGECMVLVEAYNRKLERRAHCDQVADEYKIITSDEGKYAALYLIEPNQTPWMSFSMPEQRCVVTWCYETFENPDDECDYGNEDPRMVQWITDYFADLEEKRDAMLNNPNRSTAFDRVGRG